MKKRILAALTAAVFVLLSVCSALPALAKTEKPTARFDTPEGYNDNDYQKLVAFLETEDEDGVKNGEKRSKDYDPADPETWYGVEWDRGRVVRFYCEDYFLIGDLDLSGCTALETLRCGYNELTGLDVSGCTALIRLYCYENELTGLDVSGCAALEYLYCDENALTELDVSANTELNYLYCSGNALTELDVSANTWLHKFDCSDNALTELDVSANAWLEDFDCSGNALTELDVSANACLSRLYCSGNALTELSANTELIYLDCSYNALTELDVSANAWLRYLCCLGNALTELDLSNNSHLFFDAIRAEGSGTIGYKCELYYDEYEDELICSAAVAQPDTGSEFLGWYTEEGELISTELELDERNTEHTRVVARFGDEPDPIPGDSDGSGVVDTTDALYVLRCALGISGDAADMMNCDMNGDGVIDTTDALLVLRLALGIA